MVAQPFSEFMTPEFIERTAKTLSDIGFVSDEHEFAPYRETLSEHVSKIEKALKKEGYDFTLSSGFITHPGAGYAYYIYDYDRFKSTGDAGKAVAAWLDKKYK